jgi:hypothetical protein
MVLFFIDLSTRRMEIWLTLSSLVTKACQLLASNVLCPSGN